MVPSDFEVVPHADRLVRASPAAWLVSGLGGAVRGGHASRGTGSAWSIGGRPRPCRFPAGEPAPVEHPPLGPRQAQQHGPQRDNDHYRRGGLAGQHRAMAGRGMGRRAGRVHPRWDRAASGHAAGDRALTGPGPLVRCGPPSRHPGVAGTLPGGGRRCGPRRDGGNLAPGSRGLLPGCPGPVGPAGGRRRQHRCAGQEHRNQQAREAGGDLVGAPPQRVLVQAQPARKPY
jgi:hypothetical protein